MAVKGHKAAVATILAGWAGLLVCHTLVWAVEARVTLKAFTVSLVRHVPANFTLSWGRRAVGGVVAWGEHQAIQVNL